MMCGGLMAAEADGDRFRPAREWMSAALRPLTWITEIPSRVSALTAHLDSREQLLSENASLRRRQFELDAQLQRYAALDAENRRIRELLDASTRLSDKVAVADILSANQDPYRQQITLNKGERDGVYRGQAIVDASGVLGQVVQVYAGTSIGLLLTDPDHGVPVEIVRNGLQGIALGQGTGQPLKLPFLPANADVEKGDVLVSSSLGGRFPSGYPVGLVEAVQHTPGGHFKDVIATPLAKVGSGRQALLVWSERMPIDPVQASEAAAAEATQGAIATPRTTGSEPAAPGP